MKKIFCKIEGHINKIDDYIEITDNDIKMIFCYPDSNRLKAPKTHKLWFENRPNIKKYLDERYNDTMIKDGYNQYVEILYRIIHHIDVRPVCLSCGKPVEFENSTEGFRKFCCNKCVMQSEHTKNKIKQTCIEKYGVDNALKSQEIREKMEQTNLERYGVRNVYQSENIKKKIRQTHLKTLGVEMPMQSKKVLEKAKKTCIEKYGVDRPSKNKECIEKAKRTCIEKYGVDNALKSPKIREKIEKTNLKRYGVKYATALPEYQEKQRKTCLEKFGAEYYIQSEEGRKHYEKIWDSEEYRKKIRLERAARDDVYKNTSGERILQKALKEIYGEIKCQYTSDLYKHNCDLYVPSIDLYIEYQGSQYHNTHLYDENNDEDVYYKNIIEIAYQNTNNGYYLNCLKGWTEKDVLKYNEAKNNNLHMIFIYPEWFKEWRHYEDHERRDRLTNKELKEVIQNLEKIIKEIYKENAEHCIRVGEIQKNHFSRLPEKLQHATI